MAGALPVLELPTAQPAASGLGTASGSSPGILGAVLALPTTQLQLVRSILGAEQATSGSASPHQVGLALSVAAGGSVSYTNSVPDRYNWLLAAPMRVVSTLYDSALTITVAIDSATNVMVEDFPLSDATNSVIAEFGIVRRALFLTIVNGTAAPAIVTFDTQYASVLESVVNDVWIPTLTGDFKLIEARAAALTASGYVPVGVN